MTSDVTLICDIGGQMSPRTKKGRNEQLIRLLAILRDLDRRDGCSLYELAERYGTTVRTIRRDLDALEAAGLPLVDEDDGRMKRWRIEYPDPRRQLGQLIDASHYLAVIAAIGAGSAAVGTRATRVALDDLATKLQRVLAPEERQRIAAIGDAFRVGDHRTLQHQPPDILWPLAVAITDYRLCDIQYTSVAGRRSRMSLLPMRLFTSQGGLYLLAYYPKREVVLTLALHRIRSLRATDTRGERPADVDVARYVESLFGAEGTGHEVGYKLRFDSIVAPYIRERIWHSSQAIRNRRDGGVELTFTCQESVEVSAWVASWRHHVEVLAPASLRAELAALGAAFVRRYRDQGAETRERSGSTSSHR